MAETERTEAGRLMAQLFFETARTFFRLRAAGKRVGAVRPWGGGALGLLQSLAEEGPQTVPALARARPVSRQRIQRLVDELATEGLLEFLDNPAHKRSKLVAPTAAGRAATTELQARMRDAAEALAVDFEAHELAVAADVLARLRAKLAED